MISIFIGVIILVFMVIVCFNRSRKCDGRACGHCKRGFCSNKQKRKVNIDSYKNCEFFVDKNY